MNPNKYPTHNKSHFFKYLSAKTALLVLQTKTFRYSSPLKFNDPFDVQTELLFDFDKRDFPDIVFNEIEKIVLGKRKVKLNLDDEWGQAVSLLKAKVKEYGYDRALAESIVVPNISLLTEIMEKTRNDYNKVWKDFLPRLRVFSISEVHDNILMWSHYADYHKGVVLKLRVLPELDNLLCLANPVLYQAKPPFFYTTQDWVDDLLSIKEIKPEKLYFEYAYIKSDIWQYEREWRVWDLLSEKQDKFYSDYSFHPEEIEAIYFGCKTKYRTKEQIIKIASKINNDICFYDGQKLNDSYRIDFTQI